MAWRLGAWAALFSVGLIVIAPFWHSHSDMDQHPECAICLVCSMVYIVSAAPVILRVIAQISTAKIFISWPLVFFTQNSILARAPPSVLHR